MGWMAPLRHLGARMLADRESAANREPSVNEIMTVGLDLAKNVFQVHGIDAEGSAVLRKQLRRAQVLENHKDLVSELYLGREESE